MTNDMISADIFPNQAQDDTEGFTLPEELLLNSMLLFEDEEGDESEEKDPGELAKEEDSLCDAGKKAVVKPEALAKNSDSIPLEEKKNLNCYQMVRKEIDSYLQGRQENADRIRENNVGCKKPKQIKEQSFIQFKLQKVNTEKPEPKSAVKTDKASFGIKKEFFRVKPVEKEAALSLKKQYQFQNSDTDRLSIEKNQNSRKNAALRKDTRKNIDNFKPNKTNKTEEFVGKDSNTRRLPSELYTKEKTYNVLDRDFKIIKSDLQKKDRLLKTEERKRESFVSIQEDKKDRKISSSIEKPKNINLFEVQNRSTNKSFLMMAFDDNKRKDSMKI
jgi:hypothetical protein